MSTLQLNNAANWALLYDGNFQSAVVLPKEHLPIGPQLLPVVTTHRILAAGCSSPQAKPNWNLGGWLTPIVDCHGTDEGGDLDAADLGSWRIPVNRNRLLTLPPVAPSYRLRFQPPKYFREIRLTVYQYIGTDSTYSA